MVAVDLPESVAANAIVNIRAPGRFIEGNADHISLIVAREVLADERLHGSARDGTAANIGVVDEHDFIGLVSVSLGLFGLSSLATLGEE
jgi:hypothetical protein